jgi:hypothetical protein
MHPNSVNEDKPEVYFKDGVAFVRRTSGAEETASVPRDLIQDPPEWARILIDKGASVPEFLIALGAQARGAQSLEQRKDVLAVFEQFALWGEGRRAAELILGPTFIARLTADISVQINLLRSNIIVSANYDLQAPSAKFRFRDRRYEVD